MRQLRSEHFREKVFHVELEIGLVEPEWDSRGYQGAGDSRSPTITLGSLSGTDSVGDPEI